MADITDPLASFTLHEVPPPDQHNVRKSKGYRGKTVLVTLFVSVIFVMFVALIYDTSSNSVIRDFRPPVIIQRQHSHDLKKTTVRLEGLNSPFIHSGQPDSDSWLPSFNYYKHLNGIYTLSSNPWTHSDDPGSMGTTSAETSYYKLLNPTDIKVGDIIHFAVIVQDANKRKRVGGGDFWLATLSSDKNPNASTAGKIVDYDNGTYSVYFVAAWNGSAKVQISLVHNSDATCFLDSLWNTQRILWTASYNIGNKKTDTSCFLITSGISTWNNMCEYPNPKALGKTGFMCEKRNGFPCSSLNHGSPSTNQKKHMIDEIKGLVKGHEKLFGISNGAWKVNQRLGSGPKQIEIKGHGYLVPPIDLPYCGPNLEIPISDGFWHDGIWTSFKCKKRSLDVQYVGECFRNKEIYLLGDSTLRQWGKVLASLMSGHGIADEFVKHYVKAYNSTLTFHFHQVRVGKVYSYDLNEYEVDVLDSLRNPECNYVIVFDASFHYVQWSREAYKDRLLHLRAASMELLARCPDVPIVFKGPHPRDHPYDVYINLSVSDYIIHEMLQLARYIFNQPGVQIYLLETWDLALSYPSPNKVHMPYHTEKEEEVAMFLSYACQMKETK
ncbi:NXPE family member 4-like [Amphiura filiformis]|uniref:NXPE family member 4-like n=1 Tax=Amphiura filiformis TaxID=82378 RepID=UPI003B20ECD7